MIGLFNTAHGLGQIADISMPGEKLLALIKCYAGSPRTIFFAHVERIYEKRRTVISKH
jgi:hypothetical protein